jgi:hypothetical protein
MNSIKNFLLEIAYHEDASAEFSVKGVQLYLTVKNMSQTISQRIVKKHFPESTLYTLHQKDTVFKIF